ncbi:MAG TPA: response regulator [Gemmatimonadales bacterium]|nr:response regulator [Gemmatimonadales bacterium]
MLIVEDDSSMVSMLRAILENEGYQDITVVESGHEALDPAASSDVVLLDNQLPDGAGIDLLPRLLARPDPPSVIMVTGEGSEELAANAMRLGAEDYLVKGPQLFEALPGLVERARRNRLLRSTKTEVERDLVRAERLAAIGEMTVTLHHELNNPLMGAFAEVELLLADGPLAPDQRESLEMIRRQMLRMRDIIKKAGDLQHANSTEYLHGLSMITLSAAEVPVAIHRGRAVLCIPDLELGRATSLLLRHAGFSVDRAATLPEVLEEAARLDTTLVVIALPAGVAERLRPFGTAADRGYSLVILVSGDQGAAVAGADLTLALPYDPGRFAADILSTMSRRGS